MASPACVAPEGLSSSNTNSSSSSNTNSSSSSSTSSSSTSSSSRKSRGRSSSKDRGALHTGEQERQPSPSCPSGTVFYNWVVSPVCNRICEWFPPCMHPDLISFLGLCCASAAAYCCCAANVSGTGSELAFAALFWVLYGLFDNIDGKQARRLGLCSAGGDFFDHSSDSVSSSFAALIIVHMLCGRLPVSPEAAGLQQECVSLAFLRYVPGLKALLPLRGEGFKVCFQPVATLNVHPGLFSFCFVMLSQVPFFIATWAHPIVGRTMLSACVDGPGNFSVDELNLLVIPGLLLLKARHPWVFILPLSDAVAAVPVLGPLLHPCVSSCLEVFRNVYLPPLQLPQKQQQQQQLTLGLCLLIVAVVFSIVQSCSLLWKLMTSEHLPRFLPGVAFFCVTFWFGPPLGLQIICFSLLCLELIAARLKLHVRSLLYLWFPVKLYCIFCLCLAPPVTLQRAAAAWGFAEAFRGDPFSDHLLSRMVFRVRRSYELHEIFAVFSFGVLFCCLFVYKHIINRRNHPRGRAAAERKQHCRAQTPSY